MCIIIFIMIVLHDDAHLLIFEIIEILWHKDSRFLDFSPQEQTLFLTRNSAVSQLFILRYSIDGPSFRWRIDGGLMDYRWSILGVLRRELLIYALRIRNAHQPSEADVRYFQVVITVHFSLFLGERCLI